MTPQEWVAEHFARCAPWLQAALDQQPVQTHTLEHVRAVLDSGKCQLWPTPNSVIVTQIITYPTGARVMHHWLAGGDRGEIEHTTVALEAFARAHGCVAIEVTGRPGWLPTMRRHGARAVKTHFWKDL